MESLLSWGYLLMGIVLFVALVRGSWEFFKAYDLGFSQEKANEVGRHIDVRKARCQGVATLEFGLPLGLLVIGMLFYHYNSQFDWRTYTVLSIIWFLSAPLRKYWQLAATARLARKLVKSEIMKPDPNYTDHSAWQMTLEYYQRGARRPSNRTSSSRLFVGRLKWLNSVSLPIRALGYLRGVFAVFAEGVASLIWPISAVVMVFHHSNDVNELDIKHPWWGYSYY